jgi:hypothetical protein
LNDAFEQLHATQVKALVKKLGNKALSDTEIRKEVNGLKIPKFSGVFLQNSVLPEGNCTYIINQDVVGGPGIHWLGVVQQNKTCYVYDSFGRSAGRVIPKFHHIMVGRGYKIRNTDLSDADQHGDRSVTCGHRAISALMIYKKHGLDGYMQL